MPRQGQRHHSPRGRSLVPYLEPGTGRTWALYPPTEMRVSVHQLKLQLKGQVWKSFVSWGKNPNSLSLSTETHGGEHRIVLWALHSPRHQQEKNSHRQHPQGKMHSGQNHRIYEEKAKSTAGNQHTPPLQPSSQEEEEITPAELEVIRQSERDFEIGSVGNRKSFKGFEKKPDMLKGVFYND